MTNKHVNVRRTVEALQLYIIARCASNDKQIAYIDTRVEDLVGLKEGLHLGEIDEQCMYCSF